MKTSRISLSALVLGMFVLTGCSPPKEPAAQFAHPDVSGWATLFESDLSNAEFPAGVWTVADGVLTASKDQAIWHCGAIFGHLAPTKSVVKKPGEWNRFTINCLGQKITVVLNGERVTEMDMSRWTSAKTNPDGSEIPAWLSRPFAELATKGRIGFQGKHAGAPIFFRNIKIKELR